MRVFTEKLKFELVRVNLTFVEGSGSVKNKRKLIKY